MQLRIAPHPSCRFGLHARTVWKPAKKHDLFQYGHCPRCQLGDVREIRRVRRFWLVAALLFCGGCWLALGLACGVFG